MGATDRLHGYDDRKDKKISIIVVLNIGIQWVICFTARLRKIVLMEKNRNREDIKVRSYLIAFFS